MELFHPRVAQLRPAIAWLREKGVPPGVIINLFRDHDITEGYVRQLHYRERQVTSRTESRAFAGVLALDPDRISSQVTAAERTDLGLRSDPDLAVLTDGDLRSLEELESKADSIVASGRSKLSFS